MRETSPVQYLRIVASIVPRDFSVEITTTQPATMEELTAELHAMGIDPATLIPRTDWSQ